MSLLAFNQMLLAQAAAPEAPMSSVFEGIDADKRFVLLIITISCATAIIIVAFGMVSSAINSISRRRAEMDLKREMIERGMSADEIAKIIESATPPEDATQRLIASWARKKSG